MTDPDPKVVLTPKELRVLDKPPEGQLNMTVHEHFLKPAKLETPADPAKAKAWWEGQKPELEKALREKVFRAWPQKAPELNAKEAADKTHDGVRLRAFDFVSELDRWVTTGKAPAAIPASRVQAGKVERTRPLCAYPQFAAYTGQGDINDAANFECRAAPK